jgi:hypothetical protein
MAADYRLADYLVFLTDLSETGKPYFLEGGAGRELLGGILQRERLQ